MYETPYCLSLTMACIPWVTQEPIVESIHEQLQQHKPLLFRNSIHKLQTNITADNETTDAQTPVLAARSQPIELLCPLSINIQRGDVVYSDSFEWDLASQVHNDIDTFARRVRHLYSHSTFSHNKQTNVMHSLRTGC